MQTKWLNRNVLSFGLASFLGDFSYEMANVLLPLLTLVVAGTHAPAVLGLAVGLASGLAGVLKVPFGWLSDTRGNKKLFKAIGYFISALGNALLGFATQAWHIVWSQIAAWTGSAVREPARDSVLASSVAGGNVAPAFGFQRALDTLGALVGPALAYMLIKYVSVRVLLFLTIIPGIAAGLLILFATNDRVVPASKKKRTPWSVLKDLSSSFKNFLFVMLLFGIANFSKTFLVLRATQLLGFDASHLITSGIAIGLYVVLNAVRAITEFTVGLVSRFMGKRVWLAAGFICFIIACILLVFTFHSKLLWALIFILVGISSGILSTTQRAYAAELVQEPIRGTGFGLLSMINNIGAVISSIVVGVVWTYLGAPVAFAYAGAMATLAMIALGIRS
ncbi:MFS transporter [Candidatus Dependentiae bacterium Noda2021]|nr:MFS transporter [Candidatus Dependentiae bacterium Noda2021]